MGSSLVMSVVLSLHMILDLFVLIPYFTCQVHTLHIELLPSFH